MMKLQAAAKQELFRISSGIFSGSLLTVIVFAMVGHFAWSVAYGAVLGAVVAIINFYSLCISVQKAAEADAEKAQLIMKASYGRRMLLTFVALILGFAVDVFHPIAVVIPLFLPRIIIYIMQWTGVYRPDKADKSGEKGGN